MVADLRLTPAAMRPGDFLPFFRLLDAYHQPVELHTLGGKRSVLFFLPDDEPLLKKFAQHLDKNREALTALSLDALLIVPASSERLKHLIQQLPFPHFIASDYQGELSRALGFYDAGANRVTPRAVLLNPNMQAIQVYAGFAPEDFSIILEDARLAFANTGSPEMPNHAPVLVVPNVFSPELCREVIEHWRQGKRFEGLAGGGQKPQYRPNSKIRTHCIVAGDMLGRIDETLSRSLFPEIRKVFNFDVAFREPYKIGCYESEKGGFFEPHRDNMDHIVRYRRYAMSLNLNDDFEGGEVSFPEYGERLYKPAAGSAVIFSCSMVHGATKVTQGRRFVLVGFLHGSEQEKLRRRLRHAAGEPDSPTSFRLHSKRHYPGTSADERGAYRYSPVSPTPLGS